MLLRVIICKEFFCEWKIHILDYFINGYKEESSTSMIEPVIPIDRVELFTLTCMNLTLQELCKTSRSHVEAWSTGYFSTFDQRLFHVKKYLELIIDGWKSFMNL